MTPLRTLEPLTPVSLERQWRLGARVAAGAPVLPAAVGLLLLLAHGVLPLGVVALGVVLVLVAILWSLVNLRVGSPKRVLAGLPTTAVDHEGLHEFVNLLEGLCAVNGVALPDICLIDDVALNALVLGWDEQASTMVLTTGLLEVCDRMELEGIIARELAQIKRGDMRDAAFASVACGTLALLSAGAARLVDVLLEPSRASGADVGGVSITRYPPGLTRALQRLESSSTVRPRAMTTTSTRLTAALWLVGLEEAEPRSPKVGHLRLGERVGLLAEL